MHYLSTTPAECLKAGQIIACSISVVSLSLIAANLILFAAALVSWSANHFTEIVKTSFVIGACSAVLVGAETLLSGLGVGLGVAGMCYLGYKLNSGES